MIETVFIIDFTVVSDCAVAIWSATLSFGYPGPPTASKRTLAVVRWPFSIASSRIVSPSLVKTLGSAPCDSRACSTSVWPSSAAKTAGVQSSGEILRALMFAPFLISSSTIARWPDMLATDRQAARVSFCALFLVEYCDLLNPSSLQSSTLDPWFSK